MTATIFMKEEHLRSEILISIKDSDSTEITAKVPKEDLLLALRKDLGWEVEEYRSEL